MVTWAFFIVLKIHYNNGHADVIIALIAVAISKTGSMMMSARLLLKMSTAITDLLTSCCLLLKIGTAITVNHARYCREEPTIIMAT